MYEIQQLYLQPENFKRVHNKDGYNSFYIAVLTEYLEKIILDQSFFKLNEDDWQLSPNIQWIDFPQENKLKEMNQDMRKMFESLKNNSNLHIKKQISIFHDEIDKNPLFYDEAAVIVR